jgi:hypothetical protein
MRASAFVRAVLIGAFVSLAFAVLGASFIACVVLAGLAGAIVALSVDR